MVGYADYFEQQIHQGLTGSAITPINRTTQSRNSGNTVKIIDEELDRLWAKGFKSSRAPNSYYDYYFSGQDMKVSMDGIEDDSEFSDLPIMELGFSVEQQKSPLYGFWSYTFDHMMHGTRLVTGTFTLATRSPDYMRRLLSKAAEARGKYGQTYYYHRGLTEDDKNIAKYWGTNIDPSLTEAGKNIFSVHPPFALSLTYGVQNLSIADSQYAKSAVWDKYQSDNPLAVDINERIVESDPVSQANRIVLDACYLVRFETGYAPDGSVVAETYQFLARDYVIPPRRPTTGILNTGSNY